MQIIQKIEAVNLSSIEVNVFVSSSTEVQVSTGTTNAGEEFNNQAL